MIDCNHPNVVRFVTCWFEEEEDSGKKENAKPTSFKNFEITFSEQQISSVTEFPMVKTMFLFIQMEFCQGQTL